jgi:hypothetical protein
MGIFDLKALALVFAAVILAAGFGAFICGGGIK